jgi:pimeloyl-ACP methyl ester carboxylesterase
VLVAPAVSGAPKVNDDELDAATAAIVARLEQAGNDREEQLRLETWLWLDGPASIEGRVSGAPRELALEMNRQVKATGTSEKGGASDVRAWSRLEEIDAPATVVSCALDVPAFDVRNREIAARIPGARYRNLPDVAHLPSLERPDLFAALIEDARRASA